MTLNDLHLHDAILHRVTEGKVQDTLSFEVEYPVDCKHPAIPSLIEPQ